MRECKRLLSTIVFGLLSLLSIGICFYGIHRNNEVLKFRNQLFFQIMFVDIDVHDEYKECIYNQYSYNEMFFSFKPLKSRYWFSEKEIKKYKLDLVDKACE